MVHIKKNIEIIKRRNKSNKSNSTQYSLENSIAKKPHTQKHADIYISKDKKEANCQNSVISRKFQQKKLKAKLTKQLFV